MHIICKPAQILVLLPAQKKMTEKNFHAEKSAHTEEKCARREKYMIIEYVPTSIVKHRWFRGKIFACNAINSGSIFGRCSLLYAHEKSAYYYQRIAQKDAHAEKNKRTQTKTRTQRKMRTQRKIYDYRVCPNHYFQASVAEW